MNYSENCTFGTWKGRSLKTGGLYMQVVIRTGLIVYTCLHSSAKGIDDVALKMK